MYTPDSLALAIVRAVGDQDGAKWLEPSHGRGAFLRALAKIGIPKARITALDLDPKESDADQLARTRRGIDFIGWADTTHQQFDRIVGNPPYVSIGRLRKQLQRTASCVLGPDNKTIGNGANLWYAFVLASLKVLRAGGTLAFVLPSSAEYADYSSAIRHTLRKSFESLELYRCRRPLFEDVQEGTVVAIARGYQSGPCRFRRREFSTAEELLECLSDGRLARTRQCRPACETTKSGTVSLGELASIRLGGVTGDAKFFLINELQRLEADLPTTALTPVLSKARHLRSGVITTTIWEGLKEAGERVWLFNPSKAGRSQPAVARRLALPLNRGGCKKSAYKIASRVPWYRTPLPTKPHGFISGMGNGGPWIALNGMSRLNATNTLYVITFRDSIRSNQRFEIALALFTSSAQRELRRSARRYADGLVKHEPGAISRLRLPFIKCPDGAQKTYAFAVKAFLQGNIVKARSIADACIVATLDRKSQWV